MSQHPMWLIVKRELGQYFGTWNGYVISAALLLVSGLLFNGFAVGSTSRYSSDVLSDFFYFASGTTIVAGLLFSMRQIAEERAQGTFPLLATSALSDGQLVVAKYFATLLVLSVYILSTLYMPFLVYRTGSVSLGHIAVGYVGLFALGSAVVAIGIFGSSVAGSQLVAIILGGTITVALLLLWLIARLIEGPLGDVVGYLALHDNHFRPFMDGALATSHLVFYASVTVLFLVLARNAIEGRRWRS